MDAKEINKSESATLCKSLCSIYREEQSSGEYTKMYLVDSIDWVREIKTSINKES